MTLTPDGVGTGMIRSSTWVGPGVGDAEHGGDRVAVDVGVDDADPQALGGHRQREVDGDRRLADAALAAGDREDLGQRAGLGERDLALRLAAAASCSWRPARCSARHHAEGEVDVGDAGDRAQGGVDVAVDGVLHRTAGDGQQHGESYDAAVDLDGLDHAEVGDRTLDLGVVDPRQRGVDGSRSGRYEARAGGVAHGAASLGGRSGHPRRGTAGARTTRSASSRVRDKVFSSS